MRLRTFTAPNMPAALEMVRSAMGDDAIIISSAPVNGKSVSVTAAIDEKESYSVLGGAHSDNKTEYRVPNTEYASPQADHLRFDLQNIFRFHNLPELFVAKMMQQANGGELSSALALQRMNGHHDQRQLHKLAVETLMSAYFNFSPLSFTSSPRRGEVRRGASLEKQSTSSQASPHPNPPPMGEGNIIMLIGPPGVGKTLTVAKLAAKLSLDKKPVTVITTDNQRAGGIEQLQSFTGILGLELKIAGSRTELLRHLKSIPAKHPVLIDTAGCNAYDPEQLQILKSYVSIDGIEPVLALPAGGDSEETLDMSELFMALPIQRLLVTRADSARRFGGILAAAAAHNLAFSHISHSASVADSLHAADAGLMAQLLLRYQLQSH